MITNNSTQTQDDSLDFKQLLLKIVYSWKWILLSLILAFVIAAVYTRYAEPVYKSKAAILIKDEKKGGAGLLDNPLLKSLEMNGGGKLLDNEVEVLNSFDLMESVVRKNQLFVTIRNKGNISSRVIFGKELPFILNVANPDTVDMPINWMLNQKDVTAAWQLRYAPGEELTITRGRWYIINGLTFQFVDNPEYKNPDPEEVQAQYNIAIAPVNKTVTSYLSSLTVGPASKTASIINMELSNANERKSIAALNSLIDIYNQQGLEDKNKVTSSTLKFLNERLALIEQELRNVEGQVQSFKSNNRITDVSAEAQQYLDQAKLVDQQKAQQQTQLTILESLESNLRNNQNDPRLVPSGSGITEPSLAEMIQTHNRLVLEKERQEERLGPKNPIPVDLANQIASLRQNLLGNIANLKRAYRINLNDLSGKDAELNSRIRNIPKIEKNLVQIQRDQSVKEQLYFLLLQKREEAAITEASTVSDSRSVERPRSIGLVSPKKPLIFAVAIFFGLLIPIAFIYIRNLLNNKIDNAEEVSAKSKAPLLGEISYVKKDNSPIVVQKGSRSIIAEQFRSIRTNINYTKAGENHRVIMVTSQRPEEGKSFTAINLAASYAMLNKKTVILEFDLRKPRLSQSLGIKAQSGISNYLTNSSTPLNEMLEEIEGFDGKFFLLPAGPIPPSPAELILGDRMDLMMKELKEKFDYIIIDTPPYSLVTDSSLIAAYSDLNVVVLRQGFTFKIVLEQVNKKVVDNPKQHYYTVINRVGERNKYGYQQYTNGYTEYFDTPAPARKWWRRLLN